MESEIERKLRDLDTSMENIFLKLNNLDENSLEYGLYLSELARQFYACKKLMDLELREYRIINPHTFVDVNLDEIQDLLINKGYYEENKHSRR